MTDQVETAPHAAQMGGAFAEDAEAQARFLANKRYLARRRRVLPVVAIVLFLLLWWGSVELFDIKPFIAPSPIAVLDVLYHRFGNLMENLLPTAIEAVLGRPLSMRKREIAQQIGLALLLMLMVFALFNDVTRLFPPVGKMFR